jgi:hypothetical protein
MSKKYVPSFLKGQQSATVTPASSDSAPSWLSQRQSAPLAASNKFAALADDFNTKKEKPIVNTSLPAKEAPKLAPATLASLTGGGAPVVKSAATGSGPKKSFAAKFAEQAKIASDPNYKPPPKPVNFESEADFPSLGGPKKPAAGAWSKPKNEVVESNAEKPTTLSFADKAKEWAKQKEEEAEEARRKAIEEEKKRREAALHRRMNIIGINRYRRQEEDEEDDYYNAEESSLGDDDSYEVPEFEEETSEEDDDGEFNQNLGWDGRRKDDLY